LFFTAQSLDPAGPIDPGPADLALKVIEAFDSLLESTLAVVIALRAQLNRLLRSIDGEQVQQLLVDFRLGSLGQERLPYPVGRLDMVGMVIRSFSLTSSSERVPDCASAYEPVTQVTVDQDEGLILPPVGKQGFKA
jgi:hypothetical protein